MSTEKATIQHIKESILRLIQEGIPLEKGSKAKDFLSLTKTWREHRDQKNPIRRDATFARIRIRFFNTCNTLLNSNQKENVVRGVMNEIIAALQKQEETERQLQIDQQRIAIYTDDARNRLAREIQHDLDQADDIFTDADFRSIRFA